MPSSLLYNNFTSGILGKMLRRQVSSDTYQNSAKKLENVVPLTTGGISIRPGLRCITALSGMERIIPFVLASDQYYIVALGINTIRIVQFASFNESSGASSFSSPYDTVSKINQIWFTQNYERLVLTQNQTIPQIITNSDNAFQIADISLDAQTEEYQEDDEGNKTYIQYDYDGLFTTAGKYPAKCSFCNERLWLASTIENPYRLWASRPFAWNNFQQTERYMTIDNSSTVEEYLNSINGSGTTVEYYNETGKLVDEEDAVKKVEITVSVDPNGYKTTVTTEYTRSESAGDAEIVWVFSKSETKVEQYTKPKVTWLSDITDECAMALEPGSDRNDRVSWLAASNHIFYGTMSNEYIMDSSISPQNQYSARIASYGSDGDVQNVVGNTLIYYVVSGKKKIRTLGYGSTEPVYGLCTYLAQDMFESGIKRLAWQRVPEPRLYCVMNDGTLMVMVDSGNGTPAAWCHWSTDVGLIKDIAVLDTENGQDVYLLVDVSGTAYLMVLENNLYYDEYYPTSTETTSAPIECDVVLNPVDGGATINRYKSTGVYYVDSLGTEYSIGQEGVKVESVQTPVDELLTRVNAYNRPGTNFCIEIKNAEKKDFKILCVATEVEVS